VTNPHTLEITKEGVVSVDGVAFAPDQVRDVRVALGSVAKSMRKEPEFEGPYSEMLPDEELVVRIDRKAPYSSAATWLEFCRDGVKLWNLRVAVVAPTTSKESYLRLPSTRMTGTVKWKYTLTKAEPPAGRATIWASLWPHSGDDRTGCSVSQLPPSPRFSEIRGTSWDAVRAVAEERRALDTFLWLEVGVDPEASWQDVIARIDELLDLGVETFLFASTNANAPEDR
jgi:hypothetical protein